MVHRLLFGLLVLLAITLFLQWVARSALYHPVPAPGGDWTRQRAVGAEDVWLTTSDGKRIHGWWKQAPDSDLAVLYLHGNAGNVTDRADILMSLPLAGASVLVIDYRGFGKSAGFPTLAGLVKDAAAGWQWLRARGYPENRLILHGESVGTGVALELSRQIKPGGVVLEAPFTSLEDLSGLSFPFIGPIFVRGYRSIDSIAALSCPVMIIHGTEDEVVPFRMGQELFAAAREPKRLWPIQGADHNSLRIVGASQLAARLREFYSTIP